MANSLYNFSMFETEEQRTEQPKIKEVKRPAEKQTNKTVKLTKEQKRFRVNAIITVVAFMALAVLNIASKNQYSELNTEYNQKTTELSQLKSAYVGLEMQYESGISVDNIERYAIDKLGMQLPESNQIKHISLTDEDNYKLTSDKSELGILASLKNIFS